MPSETQVLLDILEGLSRAIRELVNILQNARRVQEGDYVLTTDITDIIQAIDKMIEYNDNMLQLLLRLNYEPPAYIVTYMDRVKELRSQLHEPLSGDIVDAYQWATVTEILRIEYEVLIGLLGMQDILFTQDNVSIIEQVTLTIVTLHPWLQHHHDSKHTGYTQGDSIIYIVNSSGELVAVSTSGTELWRVALNSSSASSAAVAPDGTIYVVDSTNTLYAIDPNGSIKWSISMGIYLKQAFAGTPSVAGDGSIIVPNGGDKLYSISPSGTINWSLNILNKPDSSPMIGSDNIIYISTYEEREIVLDTTSYITVYGVAAVSMDGDIIWVAFNGGIKSPAEFSSAEIVIGTDNGFIVFYNKSDGSVANSYKVCSEVITSPVVAVDNTVYFGCSGNRIGYIVGYGTSSTFSGSYLVDGNIYGVPATTPSNKVIFGTDVGTLYIVDNVNQSMNQVSLAAAILAPVAVGASETIYVSTQRAILYAVSTDGTIMWQYSFGSACYTAPTLV